MFRVEVSQCVQIAFGFSYGRMGDRNKGAMRC
jgi:hypothetical protein